MTPEDPEVAFHRGLLGWWRAYVLMMVIAAAMLIRWDSVIRLLVFKQDLLTTDCIHMAVETAGGETAYVHEEMVGWQRLIESLPAHLPGALPWEGWWRDVAFPAFEPNPTVIFQRS